MATTVRPRRDGAALTIGYLVLAGAALALGIWGLQSRAARPGDGTGVVWATWFPLALWLVAASAAAWTARRGRLSPWLPIAATLGLLWAVGIVLTAIDGSTAVGFYSLPALVFGAIAGVTLALVVRVAGAVQRPE